MDGIEQIVRRHAEQASSACRDLALIEDSFLNDVLCRIAETLPGAVNPILEANERDVLAATERGMPAAMVDRLRLDPSRIAAMAGQVSALAAAPFPDPVLSTRRLANGCLLEERRIPIGLVGAIFEARPNVTLDVATQLLKSRNAGLLRTGAAALASSAAIADLVITPSLQAAGLSPHAVQLLRLPQHEASFALVHQPRLIPLVIVRGSGETTRRLASEAARHGVRTLAHADGGAVLYVDPAAQPAMVRELIVSSLDRLGVCNRLNLLLIHQQVWDSLLPEILPVLDHLGIRPSLPPHDHPLGHEWALDTGQEATVTIHPTAGPGEAAELANHETSGIAAGIVTDDPDAASLFLSTYTGTGAFWNATTRLLDGFKLFGVAETGINVDRVPGPRGPVTFHDLYLRQVRVTPVFA